ncbi:hypothetical protein [Neorhizobium galegae]|uniref:hypothetical protein n=1 Tax=Neorhizobium galegae TaxID=399 RepID=UPI00062782E3|nr:hypothetical protein [Neorhizobium galegae]
MSDLNPAEIEQTKLLASYITWRGYPEETGMTAEWLFVSFGMPAIIGIVAYTAYRLHEWDLDRKHKPRQPGE